MSRRVCFCCLFGGEVLLVLAFDDKREYEVLVSGVDTSYVYATSEKFGNFCRDVVHNHVTFVPTIHDIPEPYFKISGWCSDEKHALQEVTYWDRLFGDLFTVVYSGNGWVDFSPKGVTKGSAITWYMNEYGIGKDEVMAFGDGENDESAAPRAIAPLLLVSFAAVFLVQMLAPFPYEDYQVPVMGIIAAFAAAKFARGGAGTQTLRMVLVLGLAWASTFGSPLLERWTTNGQDRFWSLKKSAFELKQLRDVARRIEALDPGGREIFTQDLYLAVETGRKVPAGLEMGPFSMLSDERWRELLSSAPCEIAAFSGYAFAIDPPKCDERPVERQIEYWEALKRNYELVDREEAFGQNATTLLVLRRKASAGKGTPQ